MYESFFGLTQKPFSIIPDPEFIYWAGGHSMAFTMLEYGVMNHAGFTVITGAIGSGKSTLIRHLLDKLPDNVNVGLINNTHVDRGQLLHWLLAALEIEFEGQSYVSLYKRFEKYLIEQNELGKRTVIIIDEAQNLDVRTLEELRMMSNINAGKRDLLQIILVGQPELKSLLSRKELFQLAQRVSSDFHLNPLNREETASYIHHRLAIAGAKRPLFNEAATNRVHEVAHGTPRTINILCDMALLYGFAIEAQTITAEIVQSVVDDKKKYGVFPLDRSDMPDKAKQGQKKA